MNRRTPYTRRDDDEGAPAAAAPANPTAIGGGAKIWLEPSGITESSGDLASWDSTGSDTQRFDSPTAPERPAVVTIGARQVVVGDGSEFIRPTVALSATRPYTIAFLVRPDVLDATNNFFFDIDSRARVTFVATTDIVRWINNLQNTESTTPAVAGTWISVICRTEISSGNPGTIAIDGTEEGSVNANAYNHGTDQWGVMALQAGSSNAAMAIADMAMWESERLSDAEVAEVWAWHQYVKTQMGV